MTETNTHMFTFDNSSGITISIVTHEMEQELEIKINNKVINISLKDIILTPVKLRAAANEIDQFLNSFITGEQAPTAQDIIDAFNKAKDQLHLTDEGYEFTDSSNLQKLNTISFKD